jgi:hypothetical protein
MAEQQQENRRHVPGRVNPRGEPQDWNAVEVGRRAVVTEEDQRAGLAHWEANAPEPVKELLRASTRKRDPGV